jgi:hypothetical protein
MKRFIRSGRLLVVAGVAVWIGSPPSLVQAQPVQPGPNSRSGGNASGSAIGSPRVSISRLQVIKPDPAPPGMRAGFLPRHRFGFEDVPREGTSLTLVIDEPERLILSLEAKDCKINSFRDDKDTDLALPKIHPEGAERPFNALGGPDECSFSTEVDPAGHRATVTVHSPQLPVAGAKGLVLNADLVVKYGHGERTVEQKNVNLKVDKVTVGPSPLVVMSQVEASEVVGQQREGTQVIVFHQGPLRDIQKVAFLGPDGDEIPTKASGSGQSGSLHQSHYTLAKKVETCTIRLTVPETVETVTLAVSINTGIGFPRAVRWQIRKVPEARRTVTGGAPQ